VAIREESDMPLSPNLIYTEEWVKAEEREIHNLTRVEFTIAQVKKFTGVRYILDVGCGCGMLVDRLNSIGYQADGVDFSQVVLEYARRTKKGRFFWGCADALGEIAFDRKYDVVLANHLIEHLRNPKRFLEGVRKILHDKGYLYIETPNLNAYRLRSIWRYSLGGLYDLDHRICYTPNGLRRLLENSGFVVEKMFTKTYSVWIFDGVVQFIWRMFRAKDVRKDKEMKEFFTKFVKMLYRLVRNSFALRLILYIPNRISELRDRGVQLIAIAKKIESRVP